MPFDASTATPVEAAPEFDPSSAEPVAVGDGEKKDPFALDEAKFTAASPLERLKMMVEHPWDKYVASVDQGFTGPIKPTHIEGESVPGQIAAAGVNVAQGVGTSVVTPGAAAAIVSPATILYSIPRFAVGGVEDIYDAVKGAIGGTANTQETLEKSASGILQLAGAKLGGEHGLDSVRPPAPKTPLEAIDIIKVQAEKTEDPKVKAALEGAAQKIADKANEGVAFDPTTATPIEELPGAAQMIVEKAESLGLKATVTDSAAKFDEATAEPVANTQGTTDFSGAEPSGDTFGIAARVSDARAAGGHIAPVEPGEGTTPEATIAKGREALAAGADPQAAIDEFTQTGRISADQVSLARAHGERLAKAASEAADKFGIESPEYKAAADADTAWIHAIKPLQTEWHKIGQAQQGETDIDTGSYHGIRRAFQEASGRDLTPEQSEKAQGIASSVKAADAEVTAAKTKVLDELAKAEPSAEPKKGLGLSSAIKEAAQAARQRIRDRLGSGKVSSGLDPLDVADHAIVGAEYIANGIDTFADWSKAMLNEFGERIRPHLQAIFDQATSKMGELTDEQSVEKIEARKAALQKRIDKLKEKNADNDLSPEPRKSSRPSMEEIEVLEQERDELSETLGGMRETANKVKEIEDAIAEKERKIKEADLSAKPSAASRPNVKEIEELKQQRETLSKKIADMRKEKRAEGKEARAIEAEMERLQKSIDEKQAKLDSGDLSTKSSAVNRPSPAEIEKLKQERDALNTKLAKARQDARNAAKPPKPAKVLTPEADVWRRAREYIAAGESDFDDIRHKIATDTGMSVEEVTKALAEPKSLRVLTDEMYAKQAARRQLVSAAKNWINDQVAPGWLRAMRALPRAFFKLATFGHGTVGMVTHAGLNVFDPVVQRPYWTNFFRQFKLLGLHDQGAYHERMMQDLVRDPNYITARRAGLANDPAHYADDYQRGWLTGHLQRIGLTGNRGFDALKLYRQDRFNQIWNGLPDSLRTRDMAKLLADGINHSTGVVKTRFPEWSNWAFFAPKLEGSRWAWMIADPLKAANTIANWKNATPAQKAFALSQVRQKATITGVYLTLLATNQALLMAAGSKQQVNVTDPSRSDFLAFKAADHNFGIVSPLLGVVRLMANLLHAGVGTRTKAEQSKGRAEQMYETAGEYVRGKASPFAGVATDIATQSDFMRRPLPFSSDKVPKYLRREGTEKYTVGEYALEHLMPIPVEEAVREVWRKQGMAESDIHHWMMALGSAAMMGTTGARMSPDTHVGKPPRR